MGKYALQFHSMWTIWISLGPDILRTWYHSDHSGPHEADTSYFREFALVPWSVQHEIKPVLQNTTGCCISLCHFFLYHMLQKSFLTYLRCINRISTTLSHILVTVLRRCCNAACLTIETLIWAVPDFTCHQYSVFEVSRRIVVLSLYSEEIHKSSDFKLQF